MPANTTRGFPYPLPTEPVAEGAQAIRNLAEAVDAKQGKYLIQDILLAATTTNILFSNIPQLYTHLEIIAELRQVVGPTHSQLVAVLNGDSGAQYDWQTLDASGAAVSAASGLAQTFVVCGIVAGSTEDAFVFAGNRITICDYRGPQRKSILGAGSKLGSQNVVLRQSGGSYRQGPAITSVLLGSPVGAFAAGSRATLYGIR
jgi:hypothetical protein